MSERAMGAPPIHAGGIDWPAHWRAVVEAREASRPPMFSDDGCRWDGRAERFARLTRSLEAPTDPIILAVRQAVRPTDTLLDVGAGAGRYALPLAEAVAQVTAVEPSAGMRAQLARQIEERHLTNVRVVPGMWEDVEVEAHDIAFVSSVLYFVPDAVRFIRKLDRSARRTCFIVHRLEERTAPLRPLWEKIRGRPRPPEPSALDLLNLLFSMGIHAHLEPVPLTEQARYRTVDDAIEEARRSLELGPNDVAHDALIREFLRHILVQRDGQLEFPPGPRMAIIWWNNADS
ncbi:MAG: SAM-dependent methyltransferase [Chloroflexi bacterium]|nr:SAM-dependent methyltransferase [Chloroflexota bacterium]